MLAWCAATCAGMLRSWLMVSDSHANGASFDAHLLCYKRKAEEDQEPQAPEQTSKPGFLLQMIQPSWTCPSHTHVLPPTDAAAMQGSAAAKRDALKYRGHNGHYHPAIPSVRRSTWCSCMLTVQIKSHTRMSISYIRCIQTPFSARQH